MKNKYFFIISLLLFTIFEIKTQTNSKKYWEYPHDFDYPKNILHGTYDFDEWPGIDHPVVYKSDFYSNKSKYDKFKIDYDQNTFDTNDHEGYLKSPEELEKRGIINLDKFISDQYKSGKKIKVLGIFAHPDDETILAGGILKYFHDKKIFTSIVIISNGAASSQTISNKEIKSKKLEYNAFGVLPDGKVSVKCDLAGVKRVLNLKEYGKNILKIDNISLLKLNELIDSKMVTEFGEISEMDYFLTYGPKSRYRALLLSRIQEKINIEQPDIILTHGSNGEYGHYLHIVVNLLVKEAIALSDFNERLLLFMCMPEYNFDDKITHFLDLETQKLNISKWNAVKVIPEIYSPGRDYDKPWDPYKYPSGVFMKDYGYSPMDAEPPRYEFFSLKKFK